jgi:ribonuclease Z
MDAVQNSKTISATMFQETYRMEELLKMKKLTFDPIVQKNMRFVLMLHIMKLTLLLLKMSMFISRSNFSLHNQKKAWQKTLHSHQRGSYNCIKANVKQLILGHYSTRYENIDLKKLLDFPGCIG